MLDTPPRTPCSKSRTCRSSTRPAPARRGDRARRCLAHLERRRDRRAARPLGLRQVHACCASSPAWRARRAARCSYRGEPVDGPADGHCHGVPELRAVSLAFGARQCRTRPAGAEGAAGRGAQPRARGDRPHRPRRLRIRPIRRNSPAACASASALPARSSSHPNILLDGRALLGARRAHRRDAAHRPPRPLGRRPHADQIDPDGHAQYRGGGADVRPHRRSVLQSRPHRRRDQRHLAASAQPARSRVPPARRRDLRPDDAPAGAGGTRPRRHFPRPRPRHGAARRLDQHCSPA